MNALITMIPREQMPQIDAPDLGDFLNWLSLNGFSFCQGQTSPSAFSPRQSIDGHIVATIEAHHLETKPILVSIDDFILDGNHRWMDHVQHHTKVLFIQLQWTFEEAIQVMFEFPKTYRLGDGLVHVNREV